MLEEKRRGEGSEEALGGRRLIRVVANSRSKARLEGRNGYLRPGVSAIGGGCRLVTLTSGKGVKRGDMFKKMRPDEQSMVPAAVEQRKPKGGKLMTRKIQTRPSGASSTLEGER